MRQRSAIGIFLFGLMAAALAGCAAGPFPQTLEKEAQDISLPTVVENPGQYRGDLVIWGGTIIRTRNLEKGTELYVLKKPLDRQDRPEYAQTSEGRFVAKTDRYLDPALYRPGKPVTVAGTISGEETHRIGQMRYRHPVLSVRDIHLWKPQQDEAYDWMHYGLPYAPTNEGYYQEEYGPEAVPGDEFQGFEGEGDQE